MSEGNRPEVNNQELVGRALREIQSSLQDYVISEMKERFGQTWWAEGILSKRITFTMSRDLPTAPDLSDDVARGYMDVPFCLKVMSEYKLVPADIHRTASPHLSTLKDLRNILDHNGLEDYDPYEAQDAIRKMIILDRTLGLGRREGLEAIYAMVGNPKSSGKGVSGTPDNDGVKEERPCTGHQPAPAQKPVPKPAPDTVPSDPEVGNVCGLACFGFYDQVSEKQRNDRYDTSRSVTAVKGIETKEDGILLRLDTAIKIDESLGVMVDGREFSGAQVGFSDYNGMARSILVHPDAELRQILGSSPEKVEVFTDLKWLIQRTEVFFDRYGGLVRFPPAPAPYKPSGFVRGMDITDEQRAAVNMAMTSPLSYVWGVPGSGKTQSVLAASICECVRRGERVAIIAPTNVALEQILRGLSKAFDRYPALRDTIDPDEDIIRLGTPTMEFARDHPNLCESRIVRKQIDEKRRDMNRVARTLWARRYEAVRRDIEKVVDGIDPNVEYDERARRDLYKRMGPLIDIMSEDNLHKAEAGKVSVSNIQSEAARIRDSVYGRDHTSCIRGPLSGIPDAELRDRWNEMYREVSELSPRAEDFDLSRVRVLAMTLSRFIISFGPTESDDRKALDVDHVFMDEAGYCNCVQTAALFTLGVPITMLGDHMQLPPVCEIDRTDLEEGIRDGKTYRYNFLWDMSALYVDRLIAGPVGLLAEAYQNYSEPEFADTARSSLATTFRFGENLADVLSEHVYKGNMRSASPDPLEVEIIHAHVDRFPWKDRDKDKARRYNDAEARAISDYVRRHRLQRGDYIILTPYRDQLRCIKNNDPGLDSSTMTVHRSQGREWDTVIVSVCDCRANPSGSPPRFTTSRRTDSGYAGLLVINTALSRAKRRLVLVCDTEYWMEQSGELLGELIRRNI